MHFDVVSEDFVHSSAMMKMSLNTCDLDLIPMILLFDCINSVLPTSTNVINLSLSTGTMPKSPKMAIAKSLLKKASLDLNVLRNYRLVPNLPFISKLLEKMVLS